MSPFSELERDEIRNLFGAAPEQLDSETVKKALRDLRTKYHPDNFEKFGDDTVRQLATERFQRIETLAGKLQDWFDGKSTPPAPAPTKDLIFDPRALFAYKKMKIEVRTADKDLKYHLFGTFYRWLTLGETFKIPDSQATIVADESHLGHQIGFLETIRFYLTFEETDSLEHIAAWLFNKIDGRAESLLVEGESTPLSYDNLLIAIKRRSFKALAGGEPV